VKLQFLQTLAAVVQHGSFAAAAPEVHLTASAVGQQMRQLEQHFRQPLFDRSARQVRPTPFALEVVATVQGTFESLEAMRSRSQQSVSGHVRLGTIESTQVALLPLALKHLRRQAPSLQVQFIRGVSQYLLDELKAGRLDAAVLIQPQSGGSSRLHWVPLLREAFVLVAPPGSKERTVAQLLRAHEWIRLGRSSTGGRIAARYVERVAPRTPSAVELPGTDAIVAVVSAGLGVSVIPELREELRAAYPVREISLGAGAPTRQLAFVCRAADAANPRLHVVLAAFADAVAARRRGSVS
jgi:DNA-binding transcriptional LysR family regulator